MIKKHERNPKWLVAGVGLLCVLAFVVNTRSPDELWAIIVFFLTIFLLAATLLYLITNNVRRSWIWSTALISAFILRYFKLHDLLYYVFLIAIALSLELYIRKR